MQLAYPQITPTTCVRCMRSPAPGELFVDTGLNLNDGPQVNHIYFCPECAGLLAATLGWVDPKDHAGLADELTATVSHIDELTAELDAARTDALAFVERIVAESKPKPATRKAPAKKADGPAA